MQQRSKPCIITTHEFSFPARVILHLNGNQRALSFILTSFSPQLLFLQVKNLKIPAKVVKYSYNGVRGIRLKD